MTYVNDCYTYEIVYLVLYLVVYEVVSKCQFSINLTTWTVFTLILFLESSDYFICLFVRNLFITVELTIKYALSLRHGTQYSYIV